MKTKALTAVCVLVVGLCGVTPASGDNGPGAVVADVLVVRPACLVVTTFGAAFFIVSLPVAAVSGSVHKTANTLVVKPAKATFTRPVGDLDALRD